MPYLDKQVELINKGLSMRVFSLLRNDNSKMYGLAEQIITIAQEESSQRFPVVYFEQNEPEQIALDDSYNLIAYHRNTGTSYDESKNSQYGEGSTQTTEVNQMRLIIFGKRASLRISPQMLSDAIYSEIARTFSPSEISPLKIDSLNLFVESRELDSFVVFGEEYSGTEYPIGPAEFLIRVNYSLSSIYRRGCFNLCDCLMQ
jgi:hypothetical protein